MKWSEIDDDLWVIPASKTKNGKEPRVPLSKQALTAIEDLRPISGKKEWVIASRLGKRVQWLQKMNTKIQKATGFDFTPHDLRRTCATGLSNLGVDDITLARILNHSWPDRNITSVYNRCEKLPDMRRALEYWGARVEQIVTEGKTKNLKISL